MPSPPDCVAEGGPIAYLPQLRKWLFFEGFRKLEKAAAGGWNCNTAIANSIINLQESNIPPPPWLPRVK